MKNMLDTLSTIEEKVMLCIDLLEIAKNYCESNFDKGQELSAVGTILKVVLGEQKSLADSLDELVKEKGRFEFSQTALFLLYK